MLEKVSSDKSVKADARPSVFSMADTGPAINGTRADFCRRENKKRLFRRTGKGGIEKRTQARLHCDRRDKTGRGKHSPPGKRQAAPRSGTIMGMTAYCALRPPPVRGRTEKM